MKARAPDIVGIAERGRNAIARVTPVASRMEGGGWQAVADVRGLFPPNGVVEVQGVFANGLHDGDPVIFRVVAQDRPNAPCAFRAVSPRRLCRFLGNASWETVESDRRILVEIGVEPVEYLHVDERRRLFDLVARLLDDFPERFVGICAQAGIWRSHIVKDMGDVPFVFDEALHLLDRTPYYPTDREVSAAAEYLRRTKGIATYRDLKALCGESRAAIYKYMDYEREQTAPSKWRLEALAALRTAKS